MDITFIGHASILVKAGGVSVLSDPWWRGPCFGAQWWPYPTPHIEPVTSEPLDYIYISHGHHDHFHPGTLSTLPKTAKVLVSNQVQLASAIRELDFEVIEIGPDEEITLGDGPLRCRIMPTSGDDTLMALSDANETCLNLNDALHSASPAVQSRFVKRLRRLYPDITYVFCGYGVASHFPNCYQLPGKNSDATATMRQHYFNGQWSHLIAELRPRFGFPFAADVVLLQDELFWVNRATHNPERPTALFTAQHPQSRTRVIDIAPGFRIARCEVLADVRREPIRDETLHTRLREEIVRANRVGSDQDSVVLETTQALRKHLDNCRQYLASFAGDYTLVIRFHNSGTCLALTKRSEDLALDLLPEDKAPAAELTYTTRWAYLRWALQRSFGDEVLFVGSGGLFRYTSQDAARRSLHLELIRLIRNKPINRKPPADQLTLKSRLKQAGRRLFGRQERDLYNLMEWTVFDKV